MTEVLQYFDDALRPSAFVSGALLAGIFNWVDGLAARLRRKVLGAARQG